MIQVGSSAGGRVDEIAALDDRLLATKLALEGEFDARIKQLKEAKASLEKLQGIVATQQEANALKVQAGETNAKADELLTKANKLVADAQAEADRIHEGIVKELDGQKAKNAALANREKTVSDREAAVTQAEAAIPQKLADQTAAVEAREKRATEREQKNAKDAAEVAATKQKVEERIRSMQAPI